MVTPLVIRKAECFMPQSSNKVSHPKFEWIDILNQEPLPPPNLSTHLSVGINLFQQMLWGRAQWKLEIEILKHFINEQSH